MIKGYFVGKKPDISGYTLLKVLAEMDILTEEEDNVKSTPDNPMEVKTFLSESIRITFISKYPKTNKEYLVSVCRALRNAAPEFFQYFEQDENLILIHPIHPAFNDDDEDGKKENIWDRIIEELLRVTLTGLMREEITDVTEFVKTYIKTFIKWKN